MTTINSVGSGLKGTTGTGTFVGNTSATINTPKINEIWGSTRVCTFGGGSTNVNYWVMQGSATGLPLFFGAQGSDINVPVWLGSKGDAPVTLFSQSSTYQFQITDGGSYSRFAMDFTGTPNLYNFPGNCPNGNVVCDISGNHSITTAPPASSDSALGVGGSYQNTNGYDIIVTVYLSVTAATSADILLGVGPSSTPTQSTIVSGLTLAALNIIPIQIYIPAQYYALLSTSGTITQTISGQIQIPV